MNRLVGINHELGCCCLSKWLLDESGSRDQPWAFSTLRGPAQPYALDIDLQSPFSLGFAALRAPLTRFACPISYERPPALLVNKVPLLGGDATLQS